MEITEEKINKKKLFNKKLFVVHQALSWDLLFYYTISFLFLMQVKGLSAAQIVFAESFFCLFKFMLQIPATITIEKLGKRKSIILADFCVFLYVFLVIGLVNLWTLVIANVFCAFGMIIKGVAEPNLLQDSLEGKENKNEEYSKLEGKGISWYFYIDSISSLICGFLFVFNNYLPIFLCLGVTVLSTILSLFFKELPNDKLDTGKEPKTIFGEIKIYTKDLYDAFKFVIHSRRLIALFLFHAIFSSFLNVMINLRRSLLTEINVSSEQFGLIFAFLGIIGGISSNYAYKYHKKYRNKTLSLLGISFSLSVLFCGLSVILNFPPFFMYFTVLICYTIQYITRTPYPTLMKQYLSSFTTPEMRLKMFSAYFLVEGLSNFALSFICSKFLEHIPTYSTIFMLGLVFTLIIIFVLEFMRTRVGLNPKEYSEKDIYVHNINDFYKFH